MHSDEVVVRVAEATLPVNLGGKIRTTGGYPVRNGRFVIRPFALIRRLLQQYDVESRNRSVTKTCAIG